jgi:hypothetical protein
MTGRWHHYRSSNGRQLRPCIDWGKVQRLDTIAELAIEGWRIARNYAAGFADF